MENLSLNAWLDSSIVEALPRYCLPRKLGK